jgi:hypothetical protein
LVAAYWRIGCGIYRYRAQSEVDDRNKRDKFIPRRDQNREEVLTKNSPRASMTRRINVKGLEMHSAMMTLVHQRGCAPKTFNGMGCAVIIGLAGLAIRISPASACVTGADRSLQQQLWDACPQ